MYLHTMIHNNTKNIIQSFIACINVPYVCLYPTRCHNTYFHLELKPTMSVFDLIGDLDLNFCL